MPRPAWLALGAAIGSLSLGVAAPRVVLGGAIAVAAVAFALRLLPARPELRRRAQTVLVLALGVVAIGVRAVAWPAPAAPAVSLPNDDGPWPAVVESIGPERAGSRPAVLMLQSPVLRVAATLPGYPSVVPSDRIEVAGRIRPPPDDDYGTYLARIGAAGTLRADAVRLLAPESSIAAWLEGLRRGAAAGLDRTLPEPQAGLAAGVLIGLRDRVDRDLSRDFTTAGASHVVAISGWNIAIVASTLAAVAGGVGRRRRAVLTILAIVAYVAFVGPSASVVRAGAMAGVALLARELGRPGSAAAALGWAVTILLLVDPTDVDDAGFRLSVLATAGIVAWGSRWTAALAGPDPGRVRRFLAETLGVSLAAQAATAPVVLLDFGRLSVVAPAVNLVVVPLVPAAMAAGAAALIAGVLVAVGLPAVVATLVGLPAWALYTAIVAAVRFGAGLPLASIELTTPWDTVAAGCSAGAILVATRFGSRFWRSKRPPPHRLAPAAAHPGTCHGDRRALRARRAATLALVAATTGLGLVLAHRPDGATRVVILDVGQGDAILIEGSDGGRMLVDGGPDPSRLLSALGERLAPWDRRIDALVLTHPHEDHVAGLARLLRRFEVGRVYEPGMIGSAPGYQAWAEALEPGAPRRGRLSTGDRLVLDKVNLTVLWPDAALVPLRPADSGTSVNNVSIVLLGEVAGRRFLLTGDLEEEIEPKLVARGLPPLDLLKVAHHGSRTSTTQGFLDAVRPRIAVASTGVVNPYGHPAPATIERLERVARRVLRTDADGTVEITFDGNAVRVRSSGPRPAPKRRETPQTGRSPRAVPAFERVATLPRPPRVGEGVSPLPSLADLEAGFARAADYHLDDGTLPRYGDRIGARDRSPRLLLGRRCVRAGAGARGVPSRSRALSGRCAGALATGGRSNRARPPPG